MSEYKTFTVLSLPPNPVPSAVYYLLNNGKARGYVTDKQGVYRPFETSDSAEIYEVPSGAINGSNAAFQTSSIFVPESVKVFSNGLLQKQLLDYNLAPPKTINLTFSPQVNELLAVIYKAV
jgi:hypothetical protein